LGLTDLEQAYLILFDQESIVFVDINLTIACEAARIRFRYNLQLADSLQIATAIAAHCDAFLTNDAQLKRVSELKVLVISELTV
jgi:predicted nucleic acid-binding protein